jgi:hypothetical protein
VVYTFLGLSNGTALDLIWPDSPFKIIEQIKIYAKGEWIFFAAGEFSEGKGGGSQVKLIAS